MYRHRYRQFFRLQAATGARPRISAIDLCRCFNGLSAFGGRPWTTANGDVAGAGGLEPPNGGIKIHL